MAGYFKTTAESGDWGHNLAIAHREYNAGNIRTALNLFSQLAVMGYESAQVNAAFILSKMYCPANMDFKPEVLDLIIKEQIAAGFVSYLPGTEHLILDSAYHAAFLMPEQWLTSNSSSSFVDEDVSIGSVLHTGPGGSFENIPRMDAVHCERR